MPAPPRAVATLLLALAVIACGPAPAGLLPAAVTAAVGALAAECSGVGGTPRSVDAVRRADLTGDGHDDFVLYAGWIHCESAASVFGDREKFVAVYAGDGRGGAAEAFGGMAYDATVEVAGGAATLWLTVSGGSCGRPPAPDFARESFCDRALAWNARSARFDFAPVDTVRMIE